MSGRTLAGVILLGAGGWLIFRRLATTTPAEALSPPLALSWPLGDVFSSDPSPDQVDQVDQVDQAATSAEAAPAATSSADYLRKLSLAENPSQDPFAKNPYSTASGLYQFTRSTWLGLGGQWGNDPSQAFGGLKPSPAEQTAMAQKLTASNAGVLANLGADINDLTLYAAHIFSPKVATRVLSAAPSTPLSALVAASTVKANPALGSTVQSFWNYLAAKVG